MSLVGHDGPWQAWRAAIDGPRMHHGWILAGRRGIGKASFAMQAARELITAGANAQAPAEHPDIIVLSHLPASKDDQAKRDSGKSFKLKRNITIEQIREMQRRLNTRPTLGERRVIIIDPADDLEKNAANALLKSLEEPPTGTFFVLVAHRPGMLLPTIRSRCRTLVFPRLDDAALDAVLVQNAPQADAAKRAAAAVASGGSPGAAIDFVEMDLATMHLLMIRIVETADLNFELRGRLADAMGTRPDRARQIAAIDLARAVVADRAKAIETSQIPAVTNSYAELVRLGAQVSTYNFDAGLLILEIGTLLTQAATPREAADG